MSFIVWASGGMTSHKLNDELGCGKPERLLDSRLRGNDRVVRQGLLGAGGRNDWWDTSQPT